MERIKELGRYQKAILLLMLVMVLVFTVLYFLTISREGYEYKNSILVQTQKNGNTVYSGIVQGKQAIFTVSPDKTVVFQCDNKYYGPYTVKEDDTAIPPDHDLAAWMTGIELFCGEDCIFRGGAYQTAAFWILGSSDGSFDNMINIQVNAGLDNTFENPESIGDPIEPSISTILDLVTGPEITHKGTWIIWFCGLFVCIQTAVLILFADELFRLSFKFQIRNAEYVEPTDFAIACRYIAWTLLPVFALAIFILGLQF